MPAVISSPVRLFLLPEKSTLSLCLSGFFRSAACRPTSAATTACPSLLLTRLFNLSKLAVLWLRLGIGIERIQPGHPQQNAYASHCTSFEHCGRTEAAGWRRHSLTPWAFLGMLGPSDSYRCSGLSV